MSDNSNKLNDDDFRTKLDSEYLYPDLKARHYWNEGLYLKSRSYQDFLRRLQYEWTLPVEFL